MPGGTSSEAEDGEGESIESVDMKENCATEKIDNSLMVLQAQYSNLQEQYDALAKSKETIVMRYANSEKEVIKLKRDIENSDKQIKNLMKETETLNQKNKQLLSEKQKLAQSLETKSKSDLSQEENRRLRVKVDELQNELKSLEITKSQFTREFAEERLALQTKYEESKNENAELRNQIDKLKQELETLKQANVQTEDIQAVQKECEKLREELASKEFIIRWTQDRVLALECECEQTRHSNAELLNDMSTTRSKEIELLSYTQQVTEKNVSLQSKLSAVEAKISALEDENKKLTAKVEASACVSKGFEKTLAAQKSTFQAEKQVFLDEIDAKTLQIAELQQQLDEARGEISMIKKKHEASLKELSKELRRQVKDSLVEGTLSSRTSSCSSLNTVDTVNCSKAYRTTENVPPEPQNADQSVLPDQQALVERILRLQRALVKKQERIDFLQDHGNQLVDELQKKCKIIQCYAMNQDPGALSSNRSDQNKAEVVKHGGVMASLFASRASDDGLTYELLLEINNKLQAVLEDSLLKNITLKENISTLGAEIFKLQKQNKELSEKFEQQ